MKDVYDAWKRTVDSFNEQWLIKKVGNDLHLEPSKCKTSSKLVNDKKAVDSFFTCLADSISKNVKFSYTSDKVSNKEIWKFDQQLKIAVDLINNLSWYVQNWILQTIKAELKINNDYTLQARQFKPINKVLEAALEGLDGQLETLDAFDDLNLGEVNVDSSEMRTSGNL